MYREITALEALKQNIREELGRGGKFLSFYSEQFEVERRLKEVPIIEKKYISWHGHDLYLLGVDGEGQKYWLKAPSWDCNWYWGLGYVEVLVNQKNPVISKDMQMHTHFDSLFFKNEEHIDGFKATFLNGVTLEDKDIWRLLELMSCMYTAKRYAEMLYRRGENIFSVPGISLLVKNEEECRRINRKVIPGLWEQVRLLLSDGKDDDRKEVK